MRILLSGGGTAGSVTPLLALATEFRDRNPQVSLTFIGTPEGPDRQLVEAEKIRFIALRSGKFRRYASFHNFIDIFVTLFAFGRAWLLLRSLRPDVIVTAGSYIAVPVTWAGFFLKIPSVIHQQDIVPGLANRICQPVARRITVAFERSLSDYPAGKTVWTGNPVRRSLFLGHRERAYKRFHLQPNLPTVLAFGGGTGALRLNQLIVESGLDLVRSMQILHITGGREGTASVSHPQYHALEFLTDAMADAYAVADVVVCRAGLGSLSEIAALGKAAVVIPLRGTHQEENARYFHEHQSVVVLPERNLTHEQLVEAIENLQTSSEDRATLQQHVSQLSRPDAAQRMADEVEKLGTARAHSRILRELRSRAGQVREEEPIGPHTHFKLGGPAEFFAVCTTRQQAVDVITYLRRADVRTFVLGGGANVVFPDSGVRGVIVQLRNEEFTADGNLVTIGAGMNTGKVASLALQHGLTGIEFIVGIYGTLGGAVRGNAGAFGTEMKDIVVACDVIAPDHQLRRLSNAQMQFGYRDSLAKHADLTVVSVQLRLKPGDVAAARKLIFDHTAYKRSHQPLGIPSAGCMFKNYQLSRDDDSLREKFKAHVKGGQLPAWVFVSDAGFAGRQIGGIEISSQHANFFLNRGQGKASDVLMLTSLVKQKVRERYGIQLREEVQFLGF